MDSLSQHRTLVRNDVASLKGVRAKLRRHQNGACYWRVVYAKQDMQRAKRTLKNSERWHKQYKRKLDKKDLMINRFYEKKEKYEAVELKLKEKVKKLKMKIEAGRCVIKSWGWWRSCPSSNLFFK